MKSKASHVAFVSVSLILFIASAQYNFLLFHTAAEFFSIVVGFGIFMFGWNTRKQTPNDFFLFLGIAYLFIVLVDFIHTLSYRGMRIFPGDDGNLPTQLWILARYMESISLLISPVFLTRKVNIRLTFTLFLSVCGLFGMMIFTGFFPDCFLEGTGLTLFKKASEYAISLILAGAWIHFTRNRQHLPGPISRLFLVSILMTVVSEISFTFYVSVYGTSNMIGHLFKILSFYMIYKAVIVQGLHQPYELLKTREAELQNALSEIRTLRGIVPICMHCKKIRNEAGFWEIVEKYVTEHSHAQFSHGICNECFEKLYPSDQEPT